MNIFDIEKIPENEELLEILEENKNVKIERIISTGQTTEWMSDEKKEFVILVQGKAAIEFKDRKVYLEKGDTLLIEEKEFHRVSYTSRNPHCIWICIYF